MLILYIICNLYTNKYIPKFFNTMHFNKIVNITSEILKPGTITLENDEMLRFVEVKKELRTS